MSTTTVVSSTNHGTGSMESSNETNPGDNSKDPPVDADDDSAPDSEVKGQLISKYPFGFKTSSKRPTIFFPGLLP